MNEDELIIKALGDAIDSINMHIDCEGKSSCIILARNRIVEARCALGAHGEEEQEKTLKTLEYRRLE